MCPLKTETEDVMVLLPKVFIENSYQAVGSRFFIFLFVINEWNFEYDKYNTRIWVPLLLFLSSEYKFGNDLEMHRMDYPQQKGTVTLHCWKRQTCSQCNAHQTDLPQKDGTILITSSGTLLHRWACTKSCPRAFG